MKVSGAGPGCEGGSWASRAGDTGAGHDSSFLHNFIGLVIGEGEAGTEDNLHVMAFANEPN